MNLHFTKVPFLIIASSLLISALMIWTCQYNKDIQTTSLAQQQVFDSATLFTKTVIPNRLTHFLQKLNQKGAQIKNQNDFRIKTQDRNYRIQLAHQTKIDTNLILVHYELATLIHSGLSELDAQILHFSHRNYQNPFTGKTFNPKTLATANSESILMNIQGFQAGNWNPMVQSYKVDLATIESWIQSASLFQNTSFTNPSNPTL